MDLASKYRPTNWDQVVGQKQAVSSLRATLAKRTVRSFLLFGPSGVGKTTLARIVARKVGCQPNNLLEIDAASHTGIDSMRAVIQSVPYKSFGATDIKVVVIDEAHALSKAAWQSLLKSVEEPPEHVYWIFCTTEPAKVPLTIQTRCATLELRSVHVDDLLALLDRVVEAEGLKTNGEVLSVLARQSFGSPRRALNYLAQCYRCGTSKQALTLLGKADSAGDAIVLVKALVKGNLSWVKAMKLLKTVEDNNPESIRLVTLAYLTTVARSSNSDAQAGRCLEMMDCFSEPYNSSEGMAPLLLSLGRAIFQ